MAAQHTPGPWEVCGYYVRGPYAMGSHEKPGLLVATLDSSGDEMRANARLIAAAPELLELAREIADNVILAGMDIGHKARSLIAKVAGEQA